MFDYFGYGSNLDRSSLRAKGVTPVASSRGELVGWRLRFNVAHFFSHEGGVANIERTDDPRDRVLGVVHRLEERALARLDVAEAYPHGYDRTTVPVDTEAGVVRCIAYVGTPEFIDDRCLPSRRYLNIMLRGAEQAGLEPDYVAALRRHPALELRVAPRFTHPAGDYPTLDAAALAAHPTYTALDGAVFDMANARPKHRLLRDLYGGRDMTTYHLRQLDTSDGTDADVARGERSPEQQAHLDRVMQGYAQEYVYVGRYVAST
jgi:hypothetical protein